MIELYTTVQSLENFQRGESVYGYCSRELLDDSFQPLVKLLLPFEAVEHLGHGEFRLLVKGLEY